jgi:elongation factor P
MAAPILVNDARQGIFVEQDNTIYQVIEYTHIKPGKGGAFIRLRLRNLKQGRVVERTFNSGEKISIPDVEEKQMQFLYQQGQEYVFMDQESYEQLSQSREELGDKANWLKEGMTVSMLMHNGESLGLDMPAKVELKVVETVSVVRGNTVNNVTKEAVLETGAKIQVPLFVNEGTIVRVDTRTGEYLERVS